MYLLVAHTTSKTLLNLVHDKFIWPTKVKLLDMFNAFWGVRKEMIEEILTKFELFL